MGYNIYIGEAKLRTDYSTLFAEFVVESVFDSSAPIFPGDSSPKQTGERWPSYTGWANTVKALGLNELFKRELMARHPGICRLTQLHANQIDSAVTAFKAKYPNAIPGWDTDVDEDAILARGIWLQWWVNWALMNCKNPAIYNS